MKGKVNMTCTECGEKFIIDYDNLERLEENTFCPVCNSSEVREGDHYDTE